MCLEDKEADAVQEAHDNAHLPNGSLRTDHYATPGRKAGGDPGPGGRPKPQRQGSTKARTNGHRDI